MESFEEAGLGAELVEALAAEGLERPTPLQAQAIPVIRRGNSVVLAAGPGSGTLVAYGAALLDRVDDEAPTPAVLVLVPTPEGARARAESLARLAASTGRRVGALGSPWALPGRAHLLFATPRDALDSLQASRVDLSGVQCIVVDDAVTLESVQGVEALETLLETVDGEGQRVVASLPLTSSVEELVDRHVRRAVHLPPRSVEGEAAESPDRGTVGFRVVPAPREEAALAWVAEAFEEAGARHVLAFVATDDRAADLGDHLTLHGFHAGAPGDPTVPVWMAVDEMEALRAVDSWEEVAVVSVDVPAGADALDRRHGGERGGTVLVLPRELAHLRDLARRTGYRLRAEPPPVERRVSDDLVDTLDRVEAALREEDIAPYMVVLETLFQEHDPAEVAAAAVALLRRRTPSGGAEPAASAPAPETRPPAGAPPTWTRLYVSVGKRDEAGPGDVLGAILGESGIRGEQVGRIDLRESFSLVEVQTPVAARVIEALNGTTVKGRSVRADYDRGGKDRAGGSGGGGRGPGRGGPPGRGRGRPDRGR